MDLNFAWGQNDVLKKISCSIKQGTLVGVVGALSSGKATLLNILGQVLVPEKGTVIIPPHLRVLHVEPRPSFLNRPIVNNYVCSNSK